MFIRQNTNAILCGNIGKDPEKKVIEKNGKTYQIVNAGVIVGKDENGNSIWKNISAWGSTLKDLKKGDKVFVVGSIETRNYDGKDGAQHTSEKINVEFIMVQPKQSKTETQVEEQESQTLDLEPISDDNLPF